MGEKIWRVGGGELHVRRLVKGLFMFYFPSVMEAKRVLNEGLKTWEGGDLA